VIQAYSDADGGDSDMFTLSSPAEDLRRLMKRVGFKGLSLEEQQWTMIDNSLNPSKYEWVKEEQDREDEERKVRGRNPKKRKYIAAVEQFRLDRHLIEYAQNTPFHLLTRKEITIRKLLSKFYDPALKYGKKKAVEDEEEKGRV
jgi:ribosomal protein L24E